MLLPSASSRILWFSLCMSGFSCSFFSESLSPISVTTREWSVRELTLPKSRTKSMLQIFEKINLVFNGFIEYMVQFHIDVVSHILQRSKHIQSNNISLASSYSCVRHRVTSCLFPLNSQYDFHSYEASSPKLWFSLQFLEENA